MIYQQLFERVREPKVVQAALIGCGSFGAAVVTQARRVPRLEIRAAADTNPEAARRAFLSAGAREEEIAVCDSAASAVRAHEAGRWVVVEDAMNLMDLPIHAVVTATRVPEAGASCAREAIRHGKHVIFVDKEADSVVGPILKRMADRAGVVFTTEDGDQPGLAMGLVSWARALGFEVICAGGFHEIEVSAGCDSAVIPGWERPVPISSGDRWMMERIPEGEAPRYASARRRWMADQGLLDATGDTIAHAAVTANGTGLGPDAPGMRLPLVRMEELPEVLCPVEEGGVLQRRGVVEIATILRTKGAPSVEGGVFVVVANDDSLAREVMIGKGLAANRAGSAMVIYRPHHLCGVETAISILSACLLGVPTGSSTVRPVADITVTAKRDHRKGEVVSQAGRSSLDENLMATLIPAAASGDGALPFFLMEGNRLAVDWPKGSVLTGAMIEPPVDSTLWTLREEQDRVFETGKPGSDA